MAEQILKEDVIEKENMVESLRRMALTDIKTVDRESLVDISDIEIDLSLPYEERIKNYLEQIKNPYCYICNGVVVKISFAGKEKLQDCLQKALTLK